jgi:hypothetical protein
MLKSTFFFLAALATVNANAAKLASSAQALDTSLTILESSKIAEKMPPMHSSESQKINFCYAFAGATLIEQLVGRASGVVSEKISMLDLALFGQGLTSADLQTPGGPNPAPYLDDLGNDYRSIIYASLKGAIARESCVPFDSYPILRSTEARRSEYAKSLAENYLEGHRFALEGKAKERREVAERIRISQGLTTSAADVYEALKLDHFQKFGGAIFIPKSCMDNRLKLPKFDVARHEISEGNFVAVPRSIKESINRNQPISWPFCISDSCETQHVVVVFGWRKICLKRSTLDCEIQYLVRDSGEIVSDRPGDYWIDENTILTKISLMFAQKKAIESKGISMPAVMLSLIEK